jgi:hypothetical protein
MRHPIEKYNVRQADMLAELPEDQRAFWARQQRIGNAAYCYQHQFNDVAGLTSQPSINLPDDLLTWLEQQLLVRQESRSANELLAIYFEEFMAGLPNDQIRTIERARGLEDAKRSWPFRRYVLERNDFGMDEFMRLNLSEADYAYYVETSKPL